MFDAYSCNKCFVVKSFVFHQFSNCFRKRHAFCQQVRSKEAWYIIIVAFWQHQERDFEEGFSEQFDIDYHYAVVWNRKAVSSFKFEVARVFDSRVEIFSCPAAGDRGYLAAGVNKSVNLSPIDGNFGDWLFANQVRWRYPRRNVFGCSDGG